MRKTTVNIEGSLLEAHYEFHRAYRGTEVDPPEQAYVELQRVAIPGQDKSDLLDWLAPGALALIEERLMEYLEDDYEG